MHITLIGLSRMIALCTLFYLRGMEKDIIPQMSISQQSSLYATSKSNDAAINTGNPYTYTYRDGFTPLHMTVNCEDFKAIKFLIYDKNANVNAIDDESNTPLHLATQNAVNYRYWFNPKIIKLLIKNGADVNAINIWGETPLYYPVAAQGDNFEVIKILVKNGANFEKDANLLQAKFKKYLDRIKKYPKIDTYKYEI